jgi:hypothetical protein
LQGKIAIYCRPSAGKSMNAACQPMAIEKVAILPAYATAGYKSLYFFCKVAWQDCWVRLPGKATGYLARLHAMAPHAESMVKLDNNAVMGPQQEQQQSKT